MTSNSRYKKFSGILVIGDVHGQLDSFMSAVEYSKKNDLFFISLGDLVDRGPRPFEVVNEMFNIVEQDRGHFIIGNHDDKFYRYAKGNKVRLSKDAKSTIESVGESRIKEFLDTYVSLIEHRNSSLFLCIKDIYMVHGSSHKDMWTSGTVGSEAKSRFLYGQVTGEIDHNGYPVRIYDWVDEIPLGKTVIVGHDRKAVHDVILEKPLEIRNKQGGRAIFVDTGCGKGGFLTGAVIQDCAIAEYKEFK